MLMFTPYNLSVLLVLLAGGCWFMGASDLSYKVYLYFFRFAEDSKQELREMKNLQEQELDEDDCSDLN